MFGGSLGTHSAVLVKNLLGYLSTSSALSTEGLFRVSPAGEDVTALIARLEADSNADLRTVSDAHVVAHTLKRYLRTLDAPLLTLDLYDAFVEAALNDDVVRLQACVALLPPLNYEILCELLGFLDTLLEYQDHNRMTPDALATVLAPCLLHKGNDVQVSAALFNRLSDESAVVLALIRNSSSMVKLERVGAMPREQGTSSAFPGVRLLSQPKFTTSPLLNRRVKGSGPSSLLAVTAVVPASTPVQLGSTIAYAVYDYKGCPAAGTLTMRRGDALVVLEADEGGRWYRCKQRDSGDDGWCPVSFLDCAAMQRTPLGREKALMRAGDHTSSLPTSSPLRSSTNVADKAQGAPTDPLAALTRSQPRSMDEMGDRMDILSRALIREKEERLALERRLVAALAARGINP